MLSLLGKLKKMTFPSDLQSSTAHEVVLNDTVDFVEARDWAADNCPTFTYVDIVDVSDFSLQWDEVASFHFGSSEDAAWFTLKWKNKC